MKKNLITMQTLFIAIFLSALNIAQSQPRYFQHEFNLGSNPTLRNERFNSGIYHRDAMQQYYYAGIGTSYKNPALPNNVADRLRFTRIITPPAGVGVLSNFGYEFSINGVKLNSSGNSIAEISTGGYMALGAVTSNPNTGAVAIGGSDILITQLTAAGAVAAATRIDIAGGKDIGWYIKRSITNVGGAPTWIICGESGFGDAYTDCFVARVNSAGAVIWCKRFNFDPAGGQFNAAYCIAKQLCEDAAGNIYVVGTMRKGANTDGLAFRLGMAGNLVWANSYNSATDDEFQAVRLAINGNLIVGGFTNYPAGPTNMLITSLTTAGGAIVFQNILRAITGGVLFPSKCYDILETPAGQQYYLAGSLIQNGVNREMMYRAGPNGMGIQWNSYNPMVYNVGFGIDYVPDAHCPGIAYFSSKINSNAPAFSNGHIMKTDLMTNTCNFLGPKQPNNFESHLIRFPRQHREQVNWSWANLVSERFNYQNNKICWVDCQEANAGSELKSSVKEQSVPEQSLTNSVLKVSPNPVANTLHVQVNAIPAGAYEIQLVDMQGRLIQKRTNTSSKGSLSTDLDMSSVTPGIYLLIVKQGTLVLQQNIVKQ